MCEFLEGINTSTKAYFTEQYRRRTEEILCNQPPGLHNVVCIINSVNNGNINYEFK